MFDPYDPSLQIAHGALSQTPRDPPSDDEVGMAVALVAVVVLIAALWGLWRLGVWLAPSLWHLLRSWWVRLLGVAVVGGVSAGLYALRARRLRLYAALEIAFATVMAWAAMGQVEQHGIGAWAAVASAAYLIVRGLDNMFRKVERPAAAR